MKRLWIILLVVMMIVVCCKNPSSFKDEKLLKLYVDCCLSIDEDEFLLLFVRNKNSCFDCIPDNQIAVENVLKSKQPFNLYVVVDDTLFASKIDSIYGDFYNFSIIVDKPENLHPYGLHQVHPHFFHMKKGNIEHWEML